VAAEGKLSSDVVFELKDLIEDHLKERWDYHLWFQNQVFSGFKEGMLEFYRDLGSS